MLSNDELSRVTRLVNLVRYLDKETQEKCLELVRKLKEAEGQEMGLPRSAVDEMTKAVPNELVRDIVNDLKAGPGQPGWIKPSTGGAVVRGTGWSKPLNQTRSKAQDEMFDAMVAALAGGPNQVK